MKRFSKISDLLPGDIAVRENVVVLKLDGDRATYLSGTHCGRVLEASAFLMEYEIADSIAVNLP